MTLYLPDGKPVPGSIEAIDQGCECPILDNNYGTSSPWPPNGWWINEDCPLHNPKEEE